MNNDPNILAILEHMTAMGLSRSYRMVDEELAELPYREVLEKAERSRAANFKRALAAVA